MNLLNIQLAPPAKYYHFIAPGEPVAWERVGFSGRGGHSYVPQKTKNAEKTLAQYFKMCFPRERDLPSPANFAVRIAFYCTPNRKNEIRRDADNMLKTIKDGLTDIVWLNDKTVKEVYMRVLDVDSAGPRTELLIYPLECV